jgi:hypothetical protein
MTFLKFAGLGLIIFLASSLSSAQKFPLQPGEWAAIRSNATQHGKPAKTSLFCLNDEAWAGMLGGRSGCTIQQLSLSSSGGSYSKDCASAIRLNGFEKVVVAAGDIASDVEPILQADAANKEIPTGSKPLRTDAQRLQYAGDASRSIPLPPQPILPANPPTAAVPRTGQTTNGPASPSPTSTQNRSKANYIEHDDATVAFDGEQHMVIKHSVKSIAFGQAINVEFSVDYRWQGPTCTSRDANLLQAKQSH